MKKEVSRKVAEALRKKKQISRKKAQKTQE